MGVSPLFVWRINKMRRNLRLEAVIAPIVEGMGYIFVGVQHLPQQKGHSLVRLYIDKTGGVTADDCALAQRQVYAVMSVESPIGASFTLEVSSPGLDRLLFTPQQFNDFVGREVAIRLNLPLEGRRNFKGKIEHVEEESVDVLVEGDNLTFTFNDIAEARLVSDW